MKWDVSSNDITIAQELDEMKRYFDSIEGFPCMPNSSDEHDILMVVNRDDATRIQTVMNNLIRDEPEGYAYLKNGRFAISTWDHVNGKTGDEKFRFEKYCGDISNEKLVKCLNDQKTCCVRIVDISIWKSGIFQVADRPPEIFFLHKLMMSLSNLFPDPRKSEEVFTEDDLLKFLNQYYRPISPSSSNQISKDNLHQALEKMASFKYNVFKEGTIQTGNGPISKYRILNKLPPEKNLELWIAKRLCKSSDKESKKTTRKGQIRVKKYSVKSPKGVKPLF